MTDETAQTPPEPKKGEAERPKRRKKPSERRIWVLARLSVAVVGVLLTGTMAIQFCGEASQREALVKDLREDIQSLALDEAGADKQETLLRRRRLRAILDGARTLQSSGSTHDRLTTRLLAHERWCVSRGKDPEAPSNQSGACECYDGAHAAGRQNRDAPDGGTAANNGPKSSDNASPPSTDGGTHDTVASAPGEACGNGRYWEHPGGHGGLPWEFIMNFSSGSLMAAAILCSALLGALVAMVRRPDKARMLDMALGLAAGFVVWLVIWSASGLFTTGAGGTLNPYSCGLLGFGAGLSKSRLFRWVKSLFLDCLGKASKQQKPESNGKGSGEGTEAS